MKKLFYFVAIVLFLFTFNSCTDEDKRTNPSVESVGASFQFEDGQTWDFKHYIYDFENDKFQFDAYIYYLAKFDGVTWNKGSYKYYGSLDSIDRESGSYIIKSTTKDGLFLRDSRVDIYESIFPEVKDTWHKLIDFKSENWVQFDLEKDTILEGEQFNAKFLNKGKKVKDTTVTYKGEEHYATIYENTFELFIEPNRPQFSNSKGVYNIIIIDGIGIFKHQLFYEFNTPTRYLKLADHK